MYDICHPTYYKMSQLGCTDQVKLATAFYVYMELCEDEKIGFLWNDQLLLVKRYWDVDYKYSEPLELFYLVAKKTKKSALDTFIPWPAIHNLTLELISNIQQELKKEKFTFIFKEGDTTSVYYSICSGIAKPISPEDTKDLRQKEMKKFQLERQITRNTANLYERALSLAMKKQDELDKTSFQTENDLSETATTIKVENIDKSDFELKECSDPIDEMDNSELENDNALNIESNEVQNNSTSTTQNVDIQESESV